MVIIDRVVCDSCFCVVGQLFRTSAVCDHLIHDLSISPHFCVCPDCRERLLDVETARSK